MREPQWKIVLAWGVVILYLSLPPIILLLRIVSDSLNLHWSKSVDEAKFIVPYFTSLTAIAVSLAGLNSWDRRNGRHNSKPPEEK
jgi:hypothetical protein